MLRHLIFISICSVVLSACPFDGGRKGSPVNVTATASVIDGDEDSIADTDDNCPSIANSEQTDSDNDNIGDACDNDQDGDTVTNTQDNCPAVANTEQTNSDSDNIGDACDNDQDGDTVTNTQDNCPVIANSTQTDSDNDNIGDACDNDQDGDTVTNTQDNCPTIANTAQTDSDNDNIGDACDDDQDGDTVANTKDNCPAIANSAQTDSDNDKTGDACDNDQDGDTVANTKDNCPVIANSTQTDSDNDNIGDACDNDQDDDGITNTQDNCPAVANSAQIDRDNDNTGDACDDDQDGDSIANTDDNCPTIANTAQTDSDNDNIGDACEDDDDDSIVNARDNCAAVKNSQQSDVNDDNIGDVCEPFVYSVTRNDNGAQLSVLSANANTTENLIFASDSNSACNPVTMTMCDDLQTQTFSVQMSDSHETPEATRYNWLISDTQLSQRHSVSTRFSSRADHQAVSYDHDANASTPDALVVIGGYNNNALEAGVDRKNDVWRSTDAGTSWTEVVTTGTKFSARENHQAFSYDHDANASTPDALVVIGGSTGNYKNDVWRSTDGGTSWTEVITTGTKFSARQNHQAFSYDHDANASTPDALVVIGGSTGNYKNDVWRSTDGGTSWTEVVTPGAKFSPRADHQVVSYDHDADTSTADALVLIGGFDNSFNRKNDVWRSTDGGSSWTEVPSTGAKFSARESHQAFSYDHDANASTPDALVVIGGFISSNDVWRSTDGGSSWTEVITTGAKFSMRYSHQAFSYDHDTNTSTPNALVVIGGYDGTTTNDIWRSTDGGATWAEQLEQRTIRFIQENQP